MAEGRKGSVWIEEENIAYVDENGEKQSASLGEVESITLKNKEKLKEIEQTSQNTDTALSLYPNSGRVTRLSSKLAFWNGVGKTSVVGKDLGNYDNSGTGWIFFNDVAGDVIEFDFTEFLDEYDDPVVRWEAQIGPYTQSSYKILDENGDVLYQEAALEAIPPQTWPIGKTSGKIRVSGLDAAETAFYFSPRPVVEENEADLSWQRPLENRGPFETHGAGASWQASAGRGFSNQQYQPEDGPSTNSELRLQVFAGAESEKSVSFDNNNIYCYNEANAFAFERSDKNIVWNVEISKKDQMRLDDGKLYLPQNNDDFTVLDTADGSTVSSFSIDSEAEVTYNNPSLTHAVPYNGDVIAIYRSPAGDNDAAILRIATDGTIVWKTEYTIIPASHEFAIDGGSLIHVSSSLNDHEFYVFDLSNGSIINKAKPAVSGSSGMVMSVDGSAYFVTESNNTDRKIREIDMSSGAAIDYDNSDLAADGEYVLSSDGTDLFLGDDQIYSVSLSDPSTTNWTNTNGSIGTDFVVVMNNWVYAVDGAVSRYKKTDGTREALANVSSEGVLAGFENEIYAEAQDSIVSYTELQ